MTKAWRGVIEEFRSRLPIEPDGPVVSLQEGGTPLIHSPRLSERTGCDIYQATKAEAETLALDFHRRRGLPVTVIRPGAIYGPGETRLLKLFRAIARGRYALVGSGRACYHPVYIDDLVEGYLLALERPEAVGEAFIIAGPRYLSQQELAETIARATGGRILPFHVPVTPVRWLAALCESVCVPLGLEPPLHRRRVDFWTKSRAFSIEKARRRLGYERTRTARLRDLEGAQRGLERCEHRVPADDVCASLSQGRPA